MYEIEDILYRIEKKTNAKIAGGSRGAHSSIEAVLNKVDVIIDSPLAATFTEHYKSLKHCWGKEARRKVRAVRHPLGLSR